MKIKQNKKKQLNFKEQKYILQNLVNSNVKKIKEIYRKSPRDGVHDVSGSN